MGPFECSEGICTEWSDGCNTCQCTVDGEGIACTEKYCSCYDDDSCVPECLDNPSCNEAANGDIDNATSGTRKVLKMATYFPILVVLILSLLD
jgi:hypothetical protein